MDFKKDYINYVLHNVINSGAGVFDDRIALRKLLQKVISADDIGKTTFLIGKTAGLELLFKYILYISDKIDKSQVTIFNLKNNFDYDVQNLKRICGKVQLTGNGSAHREEKAAPGIKAEERTAGETAEPLKEEKERESTGKTEKAIELPVHTEETVKEPVLPEEMTLIENKETITEETEVFELPDVNKMPDSLPEEKETEGAPAEERKEAEPKIKAKETPPADHVKTLIPLEMEERRKTESAGGEIGYTSESEFERRSASKEEPVANEVYYKFETRFFEDVKILEKLFYSIRKETRGKELSKINERLLQEFTEIIEISSELSDLSRQLSLDITADIFFTINLYFTRAIKSPAIINRERMILLNSSLALVNSLVKGENYLDYDKVVENMESLRNELLRPSAALPKKEKKLPAKEAPEEQKQPEVVPPVVHPIEKMKSRYPKEIFPKPPAMKVIDTEGINFKMRYLVKEFENKFLSLADIQGAYIKFDALEKVDDLNNYLRIIAKISSDVEMEDVLKLSEVSYVFLKYLKDYRMDLMQPEIQQIVKYIIFTFKMLLTSRRPEDFNVLVQYLNNPVKIFTDT